MHNKKGRVLRHATHGTGNDVTQRSIQI